MSKIYVGQTKLVLNAYVGQDITGVQTAVIKYKKPDATEGQFPATVVSENPGRVQYDVQNASDIDQSGIWTFWAYLTYSDGKVVAGDCHKETIYEEGC